MALIARQFGSKTELWEAMIDLLVEEQEKYIRPLHALASDTTISPRDAVIGMVNVLVTVGYEIPQFSTLLMHETASGEERFEILRLRLITPFKIACKPILKKAVAKGEIRSDDIDLLFSMLIAAITLPMVSPHVFSGKTAVDRKMCNKIAKQALYCLLH